MSGWVRVSRAEPCAVCERADYCTRTSDGNTAKCTRIESEKYVESEFGGHGWIHHLSEPLPERQPKPVKKKACWKRECKQMFQASEATGMRDSLAAELGVSVESLEKLRVGVGRDEHNLQKFSSWPCRDEKGTVIGFTRRYADGSKKTNQGGSAGIFYVPYWYKAKGPLFVVEGGSDVAACVSQELCVIGRPSNIGGAGAIAEMYKTRCPHKRIIVVGENDEKPERKGTGTPCFVGCDGCSWCWPGWYGAKRVAEQINKSLGRARASAVLVEPGYKDMREYLSENILWRELLDS